MVFNSKRCARIFYLWKGWFSLIVDLLISFASALLPAVLSHRRLHNLTVIRFIIAGEVEKGERERETDRQQREKNDGDGKRVGKVERAIFSHYVTAVSFAGKRNRGGRASSSSLSSLSSSSFLSSSSSSSSFFLFRVCCHSAFFLLFISENYCCATKENAFFQIGSCPVNDNDP